MTKKTLSKRMISFKRDFKKEIIVGFIIAIAIMGADLIPVFLETIVKPITTREILIDNIVAILGKILGIVLLAGLMFMFMISDE